MATLSIVLGGATTVVNVGASIRSGAGIRHCTGYSALTMRGLDVDIRWMKKARRRDGKAEAK